MDFYKYNAVIIGSGISGLYCALKLSQKLNNGKILLVTKDKLGESNSRYAQGGIVGVLNSNPDDNVALHVLDTLKAGAGLCDLNVVKYISEQANTVITDLLNLGVEFDRDESGKLLFTLEGAHSVRRILHCNGDATGRGIEKRLSELVLSNDKIEIAEDTIAVELLVDDDDCKGVVIFDNKEYKAILSNVVILASGGIGQLFKNTTNPQVATGDGLALAYNAGAILQDMEFVQFHPTSLAVTSEDADFLISEAVRGEGAVLTDENGVPFMHNYHELKDLAPRDVVARAIYDKMKQSNSDCMYLDATKLSKELINKRFPTISNVCMRNNIDISKNYIPVYPSAHYFMGGIKANYAGRTSVKGLYAIGEVSSTGLHGANRLASNSLLECVVMAYSLAAYSDDDYLNNIDDVGENVQNELKKYSQELGFIEYDTHSLKSELKDIMWRGAGIIRSEESLRLALSELAKLKSKFLRNHKCLNIHEYEFKNMLLVAQLIIQSALNRKESRGAHYREDYPMTKEISEHNCILKVQGELNFVK